MAISERPQAGTVDTQRRAVLLTSATFSQFGASVMQQGTFVLGVFIAAAYGLSLSRMALTLSALTLGMMVSGLVTGGLVDRWGPRRVLFVGSLTLAALGVCVAISPSLPVTTALLFALGVAIGTIPLSGVKVILRLWPLERRGLPMGVRQMGVPLGALAAALILPTVASHTGFQPVYLGFAALAGVGGLVFWALLPPETDHHAASVARRSAPRQTSRLLAPGACGFLLAWGQYTLITYTIPMLRGLGFSVVLAGALLACAQLGGAIARMALGALSDRMGGRRDQALLGVTALGVALAVALAYLPRGLPIWALAALWLALGVAYIGWNALAVTWAGERVAEARAGAAMGLETSAILAGAAVSAPIFGFVAEISHGYRDAWLTLAAALTLALLLLWTQARRPAAASYTEE